MKICTAKGKNVLSSVIRGSYTSERIRNLKLIALVLFVDCRVLINEV